MGLYARSESQSLRGLSDIEVSLPGEVMAVIELKFVEALERTAPETRAQALAKAAQAGQRQIEAKNYAGPLRLTAKEIVLIGLSVNTLGETYAIFADTDIQ
jgi:hypothetical protein